jgi:prefoldin subunit 5
MTTDERLDRLVERHEALAQSVELLTKNMESMRSYVGEIAEGTARLLHIAQIHEHRITRL